MNDITIEVVSKALDKISLRLCLPNTSDEFKQEFFKEFSKKICKETFYQICINILKKDWKYFPNFYQWNEEYKKILIDEKDCKTVEKIIQMRNSDDIVSSEELSQMMKQLSEKFTIKNDSGYYQKEIRKKEVKDARERKRQYKENGYVCCMEVDIAGPMKREICIENGYRFNEY